MSDSTDTVVEQTIARMRAAIRDGRYAPGQRLIISDVTKLLGVSAGPVREAIRRLTGEGLVEIEPHRGASVKLLARKDIREIYEVREVVEGLAARLAAENVEGSPERSTLEEVLQEAREIIRTREGDFLGHNERFHNIIYRMARNERASEIATQLTYPIFQLGIHHSIQSSQYRIRASEHELIAEAILSGDSAQAERAMRSHVRNSGEMGIENLEAREALHAKSPA